MMASEQSIGSLPWLPKAPRDFFERCAALQSAQGAIGHEVRALSGHHLNSNQLRRLSNAMASAASAGASLSPLAPMRLGLVGNGTIELLSPALIASAARHGIALEVVVAGFDQTVQEALDRDSSINRARPEAVLVAIDFRGLPLACSVGDRDAANDALEQALNHIKRIRDGIRESCEATCLLQTLARPPESLFGSYDLQVPGTARQLIEAFNRALADETGASGHVLLDVAALAEAVGLERWNDPVMWNLAKLQFAQEFVPLYADFVARRLAALRGKSRRCLVLDLDNTVWGGVIGDDGLDGIIVGRGDPVGEAFLALQQTVLDLRERGIVLAVSSKNDDSVARLPFRQHPEMLLKEEHIAVFQANWQDKASNVSAIAETLALGLDALVLLDDNPAERALVREALPDVAVPELPEDPAMFSRSLLMAGYFESVAFSDEDRNRLKFYEGNAKRAVLKEQVGSIDDYLNSLQMRLTLGPFDTVTRSRVTQLINKTNQFNLTTRRYSEVDVAAMESDPEWFTLQARLADRFGDNGIISVVICSKEPEDWRIDSWLMSCRVLGRRVEAALLAEIVTRARAEGAKRLIGRYVPTARNGLVKDHYASLGFAQLSDDGNSGTTWVLDLREEVQPPSLMEVEWVAESARSLVNQDADAESNQ